MWFEELPWEAIRVTLGILICCFARGSLRGACTMSLMGCWWAIPASVLSITWGIFMIVHNLMIFIKGLVCENLTT